MPDDIKDGGLDLLHHAAEVIARRRHEYGQPAEHFKRVAGRWSLTLGTTVTPEQVLLCQLDLKLVRLAHDPAHWDSMLDLIGYSVLLHEVTGGDAAAEGAEGTAAVAEPPDLNGAPV